MKKHIKEILILLIQLIVFYVFPLFAGSRNGILMVLFLIIATLVLSIVFGSTSKVKIKYLYPLVASAMFLPTVFIHYNESAFIHTVWYFAVSTIGLIVGILIDKMDQNKTIK